MTRKKMRKSSCNEDVLLALTLRHICQRDDTPCVWFGLLFKTFVNKTPERAPACQDCPNEKLALKMCCSEVSIPYRPSVAK